jgi:sporulenol synthase
MNFLSTFPLYQGIKLIVDRRGKKNMKKKIADGMNQIIEILKRDQSSDGSWNYPFETGISTDAYMIILLRTLEINDEILIQELTERILSKQGENGAWKLFHDEGDGNLTATLESYYALLYSGYYERTDKRLLAAKKFILSKGGIEKTHILTKIMLSITGQIEWPSFFPIPIEMILLPTTFPINFYSFSVYGRANITPIMILTDSKFRLRTKKSPDLSALLVRNSNSEVETNFDFNRSQEWRTLYSILEQGIKSLMDFPEKNHKLAIEKAKEYMLQRIEPDGTFYSYFSSTFLMISALLSLGYTKTDPVIVKAVNGLKSMKCKINGFTHMQYTSASVWNTSLISLALQEANLSPSEPVIKKANNYLLMRQQYKYGDWSVHNSSSMPGGWGFSNINTINPDVDDTTASLRSIARKVPKSMKYLQSWNRGVSWLFSMQNDDGGWPAFEKNTNSKLIKLLPIEKAEFLLSDPSCADITGRTLEFLGSYTNLSKTHSSVRAGVNWLYKNQEKNGSWYGRWGICYIYGTWAAITGLRSVGVSSSHQSIAEAVKWLKGIQNKDGGWGESCRSDIKGTFVSLEASTITDTAWAVDALVAANDRPTVAMQAGVNYLLHSLEKRDWTTEYPKGQGMAGGFYIHYHNYRYIFPLLALAHYQRKFLGN